MVADGLVGSFWNKAPTGRAPENKAPVGRFFPSRKEVETGLVDAVEVTATAAGVVVAIAVVLVTIVETAAGID